MTKGYFKGLQHAEYRRHLLRSIAIPSQDVFLEDTPEFIRALYAHSIANGLLTGVIFFSTLLYVVLLGMSTATPSLGSSADWYSSLTVPFAALYALEMAILVLLACYKRSTYGASWASLLLWAPEVFVVVAGFLECAPSLQHSYASRLTAVRMYRLLAPLGSLDVLYLRGFYRTVEMGAYDLANVTALYVLAIYLFASVGVQLWRGVLQGACTYTDPSLLGTATAPSSGLFSPWALTPQSCAYGCTGGTQSCALAGGVACPASLMAPLSNGTAAWVAQACTGGNNPDFGVTNFDNMGAALLNAFILPTFEGWSSVMVSTWLTKGSRAFIFPFFALHLMVCGWILHPMAVSIFTVSIAQAHQWEEVMREELVNSAYKMWLDARESGSALPDDTAAAAAAGADVDPPLRLSSSQSDVPPPPPPPPPSPPPSTLSPTPTLTPAASSASGAGWGAWCASPPCLPP